MNNTPFTEINSLFEKITAPLKQENSSDFYCRVKYIDDALPSIDEQKKKEFKSHFPNSATITQKCFFHAEIGYHINAANYYFGLSFLLDVAQIKAELEKLPEAANDIDSLSEPKNIAIAFSENFLNYSNYLLCYNNSWDKNDYEKIAALLYSQKGSINATYYSV